MTKIKDQEIYSENTNKLYPNYDALVAAEGYGYTVVLISDRPGTAAWCIGLFKTEAEAKLARVRFRKRASKQEAPYMVRTQVRPVWKGL